MKSEELTERRSYRVVKGNEIIQRARYDLTLGELKTFSFMVSKIKPDDATGTRYTFTYSEYFEVLGIERNNGKNIYNLKRHIQGIRDKSFILQKEDGTETTVGWLEKAWFEDGRVSVRFDEDLEKYLIGLVSRGNYTEYELLVTLPMSSSYSIRVYEILKSYSYNKDKIVLSVEELKKRLSVDNYRYPDIRRKILDVSVKEINEYTDLSVNWEPITNGKRKVELIEFKVTRKKALDSYFSKLRATQKISGT